MVPTEKTFLYLPFGMRIYVKVKAGSNENSVEKIDDLNYIVRIKKHPVKGKANAETIKLLSDYFKSDIREMKIVAGLSSSRKIVAFLNEYERKR